MLQLSKSYTENDVIRGKSERSTVAIQQAESVIAQHETTIRQLDNKLNRLQEHLEHEKGNIFYFYSFFSVSSLPSEFLPSIFLSYLLNRNFIFFSSFDGKYAELYFAVIC